MRAQTSTWSRSPRLTASRCPTIATSLLDVNAPRSHKRGAPLCAVALATGCRLLRFLGIRRRTRRAAIVPASAAVNLGHDGSSEATRFLEALQARGMRGHSELLSPIGVPSTLPEGRISQDCGRVFAVLPGNRVLGRLEEQPWVLEPACIGTSHEWETWDYFRTLLMEKWWNAYAWEYWRFLEPPSPSRASGVDRGLGQLTALAKKNEWWLSDAGAEAVVSMLDEHGFCVLDNFLPETSAKDIAQSAKAAWSEGRMASGLVDQGQGFARGDSVLWVNTQDPASAAAAGTMPKHGLSSAAAPELEPVLACIDTLVGDILAPRLASRLGCVRTRSHAMFTCYSASDVTLKDASGSLREGPVLADGNDNSQGYLRHLDNVRHLTGHHCGRILTTILYLNEDWLDQDSGAIRLFEVDRPLQIRSDVLPRLNRLLVFWSADVPHEVLPPRRDRFACTLWYLDREADPSCVAFDKAPAASTAAAKFTASGTQFLD
eukprot:TRINITY_DN11168_c0_g2_i1.p1 TRINITY_DN11168_c0_g2~~TRINITY_DN11168_c0_g2_i1.p1  ORF type:complete len:489 (-),score=51.79 TRINITY_DN11168_c0_g2_i1:95-1561(-)